MILASSYRIEAISSQTVVNSGKRMPGNQAPQPNQTSSDHAASLVAPLDDIEYLIQELTILHSDMLELEIEGMSKATDIHPSYLESARNLLHYLALRRHDIRILQERLSSYGLSSLSRSESHVLHTVESVLKILCRLSNRDEWVSKQNSTALGFSDGQELLRKHTEALLGREPSQRRVRIMVTMPTEAADDPELIHSLLETGMDCMRINCAHDDANAWSRMIAHLRSGQKQTGKSCSVLMDLAGPKLRTGPMKSIPQVVKWRPHRDSFGRILAPARIWLYPEEHEHRLPSDADACIPVAGEWLSSLTIGDRIDFVDQREARRFLWVVGLDGDCRWAEAVRTAYVAQGTVLTIYPRTGRKNQRRPIQAQIGKMPMREQSILLKKGEQLILTKELTPGSPAHYNSRGQLIASARIGCTLPQVFSDSRPGEKVWLDDGKIGGIIESVDSEQIHIRVTQVHARGEKLRADKGINLPDSTLYLPALTEKDIADLPFIAAHADIVGYSFVRSASDVYELENRLTELGGTQLGIVLKVETRRAFEQLPNMLLASMKTPCDGVMIARGDLAIECGFERMAEVQEEILWICEAAHVPVIWATQVLENLAKEGMPSRAEISDAAKGQRAECVMLNKGPHILEAVRVLDDILRRMQSHQNKMRPMLRPLELARRFPAE
jgi:pyruvate kinase